MAIYDRAIVRLLPAVPRPVVRRISGRYIAGTDLDDAEACVSRLNAKGMLATVDVLGEEVRDAAEAQAIADAYLEVLSAIERERLEASVSVKPTALGLKLDRALCRELLERVVAGARDRGSSSASTWRTPRRRTTRSRSTASCARAGSRTSASCCRRTCGGRRPTLPPSPT